MRRSVSGDAESRQPGRAPRTLSQFPDSLSWADYKQRVDAQIQGKPALANKVHLLEKIADQPEAQRFSTGNQGGGPGAIYSQVQKIFCHNLTADPGAVPIISTYFLHPLSPGCATKQQLEAIGPTFRRQITEMAEGTDRPAVYLLEIDALGSSACIAHSSALSVTHGAHFLVNTSENGQGPKLNPHPTAQGVENLCNPPGRGLGPRPTTSTGFAHVDGFVWQHVPGNASGCGGGPPAGTFWVQKALGLAARANEKLGPGFPSKSY